MKLFPNYTPPIPPHNNDHSSSSPANHHYHQITYQQHPATQTLAPLRLNQDHFTNKTNTLNGPLPASSRPKFQTHHHHHIQNHHHHPANVSDDLQPCDDDPAEGVGAISDHEEEDSGSSSAATHSPQSPTPPELPIRNGLTEAQAYAVNTLNHINNNTVGMTGTGTGVNGKTATTGGRQKTMRHYH